ncbi:MAG TPA: NHL repeat-containing protein [Polyangiaceae bacterium]
MRSLVLGASAVALVALVGCFGSSSSPGAPTPIPAGDDAAVLDGGADGTPPVDASSHASSDAAAAVDAGTPADALADASPPGYGDAGTTSFGTGNVTSPQGIAIDPTSGAIWVASFAGGLVEFDATDAYVGAFGTGGAGQIAQGAGVAVDSKGNVYVGDYGAHDVVEFDKAGTYLATFPAADAGVTLGRVTGVAIDTNDRLFAIDDDNSLVLEFTAGGAVSNQFSTSQASQPALAGSVGMHFDPSGNLWIADYYYHSFVQYSASGQLLAQYGTNSASAVPSGFAQPYGLTVDPTGNVWVTDSKNDDVQEFDTHGSFKVLLGASGTGPGQFAGPNGIAVDANGRVLVSDGGNNRIVVFVP